MRFGEVVVLMSTVETGRSMLLNTVLDESANEEILECFLETGYNYIYLLCTRHLWSQLEGRLSAYPRDLSMRQQLPRLCPREGVRSSPYGCSKLDRCWVSDGPSK